MKSNYTFLEERFIYGKSLKNLVMISAFSKQIFPVKTSSNTVPCIPLNNQQEKNATFLKKNLNFKLDYYSREILVS